MKVRMNVCFPVSVEIEIDKNKIDDDDSEYIEKIQNRAKDIASEIMQTSTIEPFISDSNVPELID